MKTPNLYDTSAEQPDYYLSRKLLFPLVSTFDQLFCEATLDRTQKPAPHTVETAMETYADRQRGPMTIGPHCIFRDGGSMWVRAHDVVAEAIAANTLALPGDSIHLEVVHWSDEQALIIASHSLILANTWLAVIHPSTIHEIARPETPEDAVCPQCNENLLDSEGACPFCPPVSQEATR